MTEYDSKIYRSLQERKGYCTTCADLLAEIASTKGSLHGARQQNFKHPTTKLILAIAKLDGDLHSALRRAKVHLDSESKTTKR